jgi:Na+/H+-dicarboxylate symporter
MRIISSHRRASVVTVFAILFLAFTVFGWGIGYKLSLYDPPGSPSTIIPAAKLLSQRERPSTAKVAGELLPATRAQEITKYYPAIVIVALMFGLRLLLSTRVRVTIDHDLLAQRSAHSSFFSFRPPPALLPSN